MKTLPYLCTRNSQKWYLSSAVEQWTENPRVPGSIPGGTTQQRGVPEIRVRSFFVPDALGLHIFL